VIAAALMAANGVAAADEIAVTRFGFCIRRDEMRCEEVALPGTMVAFDRISKLDDGSRAVWFFTDQEIDAKTVLVHVLEAEDSETSTTLAPSDSVGRDAKKLEPSLKKIADTYAGLGAMQLTAFKGQGGKSFRMFTPLKIDGPGNYKGRVTDIDGKILANSDTIWFSVFRRPGGAP
jgi:hypothetical protein